jgi:hypothetical protein
MPTENQIFMACLDAHLYEIEYTWSFFFRNFSTNSTLKQCLFFGWKNFKKNISALLEQATILWKFFKRLKSRNTSNLLKTVLRQIITF